MMTYKNFESALTKLTTLVENPQIYGQKIAFEAQVRRAELINLLLEEHRNSAPNAKVPENVRPWQKDVKKALSFLQASEGVEEKAQ